MVEGRSRVSTETNKQNMHVGHLPIKQGPGLAMEMERWAQLHTHASFVWNSIHLISQIPLIGS